MPSTVLVIKAELRTSPRIAMRRFEFCRTRPLWIQCRQVTTTRMRLVIPVHAVPVTGRPRASQSMSVVIQMCLVKVTPSSVATSTEFLARTRLPLIIPPLRREATEISPLLFMTLLSPTHSSTLLLRHHLHHLPPCHPPPPCLSRHRKIVRQRTTRPWWRRRRLRLSHLSRLRRFTRPNSAPCATHFWPSSAATWLRWWAIYKRT
mmetsp:Transcript_2334/g.3529  ORF Transcript_2334/g.3529 Transcript_2334/m.3529 type:complete len:205 (+) Transcript_2334:265-879(+)